MSGSIFAFAPAPALSLCHFPTSQSYYQRFAPKRASPLRISRNVNLMPQSPSSSSTEHKPASSTSRPATTPAAQLSRLVTSRRDARKVVHRERSNEKRADAYLQDRSDQVSRMEWMREQKRWEENKRRRGQREVLIDYEEEIDVAEDVADQMMPTEEEEIEALVSYLEPKDSQEPAKGISSKQYPHNDQDTHGDRGSIAGSGGYGSEDDDYDQLFMEVLDAENIMSVDGLHEQGIEAGRKAGAENDRNGASEDVEMS